MAVADVKELAALGLKPETFSGEKTECPESFFKKIDRIASYANWQNDKKSENSSVVIR